MLINTSRRAPWTPPPNTAAVPWLPPPTTPYHPCCPVATTPAALTTCPFQHAARSLLTPPSNTSSERFSGALRRRLPPRYAGEMDWLNEVYGHSPHFAWDAVAGEYRTPTLPLVTTPCMRMGRRRQRVPKPNPGPGPNLPLTLP